MALVTHCLAMMEVCCLICTDTAKSNCAFLYIKNKGILRGEKTYFTENEKKKRRWLIGAGLTLTHKHRASSACYFNLPFLCPWLSRAHHRAGPRH